MMSGDIIPRDFSDFSLRNAQYRQLVQFRHEVSDIEMRLHGLQAERDFLHRRIAELEQQMSRPPEEGNF